MAPVRCYADSPPPSQIKPPIYLIEHRLSLVNCLWREISAPECYTHSNPLVPREMKMEARRRFVSFMLRQHILHCPMFLSPLPSGFFLERDTAVEYVKVHCVCHVNSFRQQLRRKSWWVNPNCSWYTLTMCEMQAWKSYSQINASTIKTLFRSPSGDNFQCFSLLLIFTFKYIFSGIIVLFLRVFPQGVMVSDA